MEQDCIECAEVSGKTVQRFRIHRDTGDGPELHIDFTDGTSFSYSICCLPSARATLYKGGIGTPEILSEYVI